MPVRLSWSKNAIHTSGRQLSRALSISREKRRRKFCGLSRSELIKILASFLIPLLIGVFTILTTIQQYEVSRENRFNDLEIARRQRDQERTQADTLQQETTSAVYIKEMGDLSLKLKAENLSKTELDQQLKLARARTLSVVRQLDIIRKSYLIQFLYEVELLFAKRPAIDLAGADLSKITFNGHIGMEFIFDSIALTYVILTNTSFVGLHLMKADFSGSLLDYSNFSNAYLFATDFTGCDLRHADLRGVHAQFAIMNNVNLLGARFGPIPPAVIQNAILPNGSYVFYSNDSLKSDLFNRSVNLIINGDATCPINTNSTDIFAWKTPSKPIGIVKNYSQVPSSTGNILRHDCVFWGGTSNSSTDYLHQRVYFYDYSRLIDSGNASYEFSLDTGGINEYNDSVLLTMQFRAHNSQLLERHVFPPVTNIERNNRTVLRHHVRYGSVPVGTRSLLVNIQFIKTSHSPFNNGLIDNIIFYMK